MLKSGILVSVHLIRIVRVIIIRIVRVVVAFFVIRIGAVVVRVVQPLVRNGVLSDDCLPLIELVQICGRMLGLV